MFCLCIHPTLILTHTLASNNRPAFLLRQSRFRIEGIYAFRFFAGFCNRCKTLEPFPVSGIRPHMHCILPYLDALYSAQIEAASCMRHT